MVSVRPIRSEEDYEEALARVAGLLDELSGPDGQVDDPDHPGRIELEVLTDLVEVYESRTLDMGFPTAVQAIEFRMEQTGLTRRDLATFIGSSAKSFRGAFRQKAPSQCPWLALFHVRHLGITAEVLLQEPGASLPDDVPDLEWARFPLKHMVKAGWLPEVSGLKDRAEELISELMDRAGGQQLAPSADVSQEPMTVESTPRRTTTPCVHGAGRCWPRLGRTRRPLSTGQAQLLLNSCGGLLSSAYWRTGQSRPGRRWHGTGLALSTSAICPGLTWTAQPCGFPTAGR